MPIHQTHTAPSAANQETAPALRVLVADDDPLNLRVAARLLREQGHGGVLVKDGLQALQAWRSKPFDMLLLDVNMPVMDGWTALRTIRQTESANPDARRMAIFMVSGDDGQDAHRHSVTVGADGYLVKPLSHAALASAIHQVRWPAR
jgi:CheY-like chemotaxis protein